MAASSLPLLSSCQQSNNADGGGNTRGTIAVLFDGLYSPFWVAGHDAIISDLKSRGFDVAEAISDQDDAKQLTQLRAMIARGVVGAIIVHTDANLRRVPYRVFHLGLQNLVTVTKALIIRT